MERIEREFAKADHNKVERHYKLVERMDYIPVFDYLYLEFDKDFKAQLKNNGKQYPTSHHRTTEKILFSCLIEVATSYFSVFNRRRKLVVTSDHIF